MHILMNQSETEKVDDLTAKIMETKRDRWITWGVVVFDQILLKFHTIYLLE